MQGREREVACCAAIEDVFLEATGRAPRGSISDVLEEMIRRADFFSMAQGAYGNALEPDLGRLCDAVWSVIISVDKDSPCGIAGTLPGITGRSSRMDLVRTYAGAFFWENGRLHKSQPSAEVGDALDRRLEAHLLGAVCLFAATCEEYEWFSLSDVYSAMLRWGEGEADWQEKANRIFSRLCIAFAILESSADRS